MIVLLLNCGYQGAYDRYRVRPEANYKIVSLFVALLPLKVSTLPQDER